MRSTIILKHFCLSGYVNSRIKRNSLVTLVVLKKAICHETSWIHPDILYASGKDVLIVSEICNFCWWWTYWAFEVIKFHWSQINVFCYNIYCGVGRNAMAIIKYRSGFNKLVLKSSFGAESIITHAYQVKICVEYSVSLLYVIELSSTNILQIWDLTKL